jgi:hypothetical protein
VEMSRVPPLALLEKITEARDHPGSRPPAGPSQRRKGNCLSEKLLDFQIIAEKNRGVASRRAAAYL